MTVQLDGKSLTIEKLVSISHGERVAIAKGVRGRVDRSRGVVEALLRTGKALYGINTGFGGLATTRIPESDLAQLQVRLLRSHAAGYGNYLSKAQTRAMMALRTNVLLRGLTGVRFEVCQLLVNLLNAGIHPCIPEKGSVGASGDLAPLAHLALPVIGEGLVEYRGRIIPARSALKRAKLKPIVLREKEGLSLINGTQAMCAVGSLAVAEALRLAQLADVAAALSAEARSANVDAFDPRIHESRLHSGQIISAGRIRRLLQGSKLCGKHSPTTRVQDAYSFRCAPQVHGASIDALEYCRDVLEREMNAATDNPLVFGNEILSGGNFHGQPLALALDFAAIATAELGSISERRIEQLINPALSGLPAFLTPQPGTNSGFMAAQYLAASLVNENKIFASPASTDSIPTCANIEDHVSMGMTSANKLQRIVENLYPILAVEFLCGAQARDFREKKTPAPRLDRVYRVIRKSVPRLLHDRIISRDIERAAQLVKSSVLEKAAGLL